MTLHWLMRAKRWVQDPPNEKHVKSVLAVVASCLALALLEWLSGWPDWFNLNSDPRERIGF
ncbi:MAG: hypothetical protein ACP5EN_17585 [Rhodovulum sp.]